MALLLRDGTSRTTNKNPLTAGGRGIGSANGTYRAHRSGSKWVLSTIQMHALRLYIERSPYLGKIISHLSLFRNMDLGNRSCTANCPQRDPTYPAAPRLCHYPRLCYHRVVGWGGSNCCPAANRALISETSHTRAATI